MSDRATLDQLQQLLDWIDSLDIAPTHRESMIQFAERADSQLRATVTVAELADVWQVKQRTAHRRLGDLSGEGLLVRRTHPDDEANEVPSARRRRILHLMHPSTPWYQQREEDRIRRMMFRAIQPELWRVRRQRMAEREEALRRGDLRLPLEQ